MNTIIVLGCHENSHGSIIWPRRCVQTKWSISRQIQIIPVTFINNEMVFQLNNLNLKRKVTQKNIILLNAFSYQKNDFIYPFDGSVTDINIWGHSFGTKEIHEWSKCFNVTPGDVLSWERAKFKFHGDIQTWEIGKDEVCWAYAVATTVEFIPVFLALRD